MSEYLPSFLVDPVLRQARRLSRISSGEESPGFLPQVPDFQRWNPTRFWNTSPPPSIEEGEAKETTVQSIARTIQLWTAQIHDLDLDPIDSPPLEAMDDRPSMAEREASTAEFPPLELQVAQRPVHLEDHRTASETSLNPARELATRSRALADSSRGHSQSDPLNAAHTETRITQNQYTADGYVRRRDGSDTLPEDDGMGALRQRINAIWAGPGNAPEKSKLIHTLMTERYRLSQRLDRTATLAKSDNPQRAGSPMSMLSTASQDVVFNLSKTDLVPTYAPLNAEDIEDAPESTEPPIPELGCIHYRRNVKMQCTTCERWYTCRLCHDETENHILPRRDTKFMLCMLCNTPQRVSQICRMCNQPASYYYCAICKLWNDDHRKKVYHCDDCGICRLGEGLGKDFFHCKTCAACMSISAEETHKCIERSTKSDCPICGEYMFTSNKPVAFMRCGHSIHETCFSQWCNTSYKCPICSKSIANMESQFRRLDRHINDQPMPEEYRDNRAYIFCNDCNSRSITRYHWLGLKCEPCESYNTTQLELLGAADAPRMQQQAERAQEAGMGEAGITASQTHTPIDELVPAPAAINIARSPPVGSPWLLPHSPSVRSARSPSPVVGSYFGTSQSQTSQRTDVPRRNSPQHDDDDLDFWGRRSPKSNEDMDADESGEESSDDPDAINEDEPEDEDDEEDKMDIFGHR